MVLRRRCRHLLPARPSRLRYWYGRPPQYHRRKWKHHRRVHLRVGRPDRGVGRAFETFFGRHVANTMANHVAVRDAVGSGARRPFQPLRSGNLRWTYAAALQAGAFVRSEFQVVVSNWTVTGSGRGLLDCRSGQPAHRRRFESSAIYGYVGQSRWKLLRRHDSFHERA